jgi:hypothetical protein
MRRSLRRSLVSIRTCLDFGKDCHKSIARTLAGHKGSYSSVDRWPIAQIARVLSLQLVASRKSSIYEDSPVV